MPRTSPTELHPYGRTAGSGNAAWQRAGTLASAAKRMAYEKRDWSRQAFLEAR